MHATMKHDLIEMKDKRMKRNFFFSEKSKALAVKALKHFYIINYIFICKWTSGFCPEYLAN